MKNKYMTFVALAAAALATSCASDDLAEQKQEQNQGELRTVTLTASVADDNTTRVGMNKSGTTAKFYWQSDDKILVQTLKDGNYSGAAFTATVDASDKTKAEFTGDITEGTAVAGYAVYPYSENQKHTFNASNANELTYVLPATYESYTPATKIFGNDGISTNMPMFGKIENGKITFKHLGGLVVIRVDKMPDASGTLTITADQQLSGDFAVSDLSADGAQIATTTASNGNGKVTFTFSNATANGVGVFYLPLATGSYTNLKVTIGENVVDCGSVTISRAGVTAIAIAEYTGSVSGYSGKLLRSYGSSKYYLGNYKYSINDHVFVDLGLSVLWAETNIGADSETAYGNYYAWGEVQTKSNYNESTYSDALKNTPYTTATNSTANLTSDYDAAYKNWGISCRMPTYTECSELENNCTRTYTTESGVKGYKITSKTYTYNSIFLPAVGCLEGTDNYHKGNGGYYWSSTLQSASDSEKHAYRISFDQYGLSISMSYSSNSNRPNGCAVRPVAEKP